MVFNKKVRSFICHRHLGFPCLMVPPRHGIQIHQEIQSAPCLKHVRCCHQHCAGVPAMKETILKRFSIKGHQEGQPWKKFQWELLTQTMAKWSSWDLTKSLWKGVSLFAKERQTNINKQEFPTTERKRYQFTRVSSSKVRDKRSWIAWIYTGSLKCLVYLSVKTAAKQETVTFRTTFNVPKSFWLEPVSSARSKPHRLDRVGHQWTLSSIWKIICCILFG